VERRHDREDRRVVKVYLTDEGRGISHTLASAVEHFEHSLTRRFSEGDLDRFLTRLQQLITSAAEVVPGLLDRFSLLPDAGACSDEGTKG
jgi:hypothetical protein